MKWKKYGLRRKRSEGGKRRLSGLGKKSGGKLKRRKDGGRRRNGSGR